MKKIRVIQIIGTCLFVVYLILFVIDLFDYISTDYRQLIFSMLLAGVSISCLIKGIILKSQSTLWFSITLVLYAILMAVFSIYNIDYISYNYLYILLPIIASLINIAVFNNLLYIKVIILNISIFIPFMIAKYVDFGVLWGIVVGIISVGLGILLCKFLKVGKEKI